MLQNSKTLTAEANTIAATGRIDLSSTTLNVHKVLGEMRKGIWSRFIGLCLVMPILQFIGYSCAKFWTVSVLPFATLNLGISTVFALCIAIHIYRSPNGLKKITAIIILAVAILFVFIPWWYTLQLLWFGGYVGDITYFVLHSTFWIPFAIVFGFWGASAICKLNYPKSFAFDAVINEVICFESKITLKMEPFYPSDEWCEFLMELNVADAFHQALKERCQAGNKTIEELQREHEAVLRTSEAMRLGTLIHAINSEIDSGNTGRGVLKIFTEKISEYIKNKNVPKITVAGVVVQVIPGTVSYVRIDSNVERERIHQTSRQDEFKKSAIANPVGTLVAQKVLGERNSFNDTRHQGQDAIDITTGISNNLLTQDDPDAATAAIRFHAGTADEVTMRIKAKHKEIKYRGVTIYFIQDNTSPEGHVQAQYDEKKKELRICGQVDNTNPSLNASFGQIDAAVQKKAPFFYVLAMDVNGINVSSIAVKSGLVKQPLAEGLTSVNENSSCIKTIVESL